MFISIVWQMIRVSLIRFTKTLLHIHCFSLDLIIDVTFSVAGSVLQVIRE